MISLTARQESNKIFSAFSKHSESRTEQKHYFFSRRCFNLKYNIVMENCALFLLECKAFFHFFKV